MSWRRNRRRKRVWYRHYKLLADRLMELVAASQTTGNPIAGEAILKMFFELYEDRRLHRNQRGAESAFESMQLAALDAGLVESSLLPGTFAPGRSRPPAIGEFGAETRTGTAPAQPYVMPAIQSIRRVTVEGVTFIDMDSETVTTKPF